MPADSPLACIPWARAAFLLSSTLGRPMCWPAPAALHGPQHTLHGLAQVPARSSLASTPATMRPVAFEVSIPSQRPQDDVPVAEFSDRSHYFGCVPNRSMPRTTRLPGSSSDWGRVDARARRTERGGCHRLAITSSHPRPRRRNQAGDGGRLQPTAAGGSRTTISARWRRRLTACKPVCLSGNVFIWRLR